MTGVRPPAGTVARAGRVAVIWLVAGSLLALPVSGCVSKHSFRPEAFDASSDADIHVYMKDRRMVEFEGGEYTAVDSGGVRYLTGTGVDHRPDSAIVKVPFAGLLPFSGIERIETRKVDWIAALYVTAFIGIFAVIGFTTDLSD